MNVQEAIIAALVIEAKAIEIEVESMKAHDRQSEANGTGPYTEEAYLAQATSMNRISSEIQQIARSGALS